jgi:hypothetical protein
MKTIFSKCIYFNNEKKWMALLYSSGRMLSVLLIIDWIVITNEFNDRTNIVHKNNSDQGELNCC